MTSPQQHKYSTIFFDWGGVIANDPGDDFLSQLLRDIGATDEQIQEIFEIYMKRFMRGQISEAEYWQELRTKYGFTIHDSISEEFKKWRGLVANENILALAKQAKARGMNIAILSNVIEPTYNVIEQAGYYDLFDEIIASCKVGYVKPEKEIYEIALRRFNITPQESIFIDDKQYCLNPAEAMGFKTIFATSPEQIMLDVKSCWYNYPMIDLQNFWNKNSARIPDDKGHSIYAAEKEKEFPKNSKVCDLGGGTGTDSIYFAEKGHEVVLVDIADEPLEKATIHASKLGLAGKLKTIQCDFSFGKLPLENESVDVVYSRLALHYFEPSVLAQLFSEVYRILRSGGKSYLTLKSPDDAAEMKFLATTATEQEEGVFNEDGRIKTRYTIERLEKILVDASIPAGNFKVIAYTEKLGNSNDVVKSGVDEFIVNEVTISK